jgi:chromosome segregation ATPase
MGEQGRGSEMGKGTMQRDRIRATDRQRDQIRTCDQSMDRVRTRARDMAKAAGGKNFDAEQARQQRTQLRNEVRTMEQEHARLMQGLGAEQREAAQEQIRTMDQNRERIHTRLQEMDRELAGEGPNGKRVAEQARAIEREMKQWQKANRKMATEMGARP